MAHYALINDDNIVTQVITGRDEGDLVDGIVSWETYYGDMHGQTCLRTSYNTFGNEHAAGGAPFRGNYAGVGFYYDSERDAFIPPRPFPSWTLNETTYLWEAPVAMPDDGQWYYWNEDTTNWVAV